MKTYTVHSGGQMMEFMRRIEENQKSIPEEIQKVVNRNYMDLLEPEKIPFTLHVDKNLSEDVMDSISNMVKSAHDLIKNQPKRKWK